MSSEEAICESATNIVQKTALSAMGDRGMKEAHKSMRVRGEAWRRWNWCSVLAGSTDQMNLASSKTTSIAVVLKKGAPLLVIRSNSVFTTAEQKTRSFLKPRQQCPVPPRRQRRRFSMMPQLAHRMHQPKSHCTPSPRLRQRRIEVKDGKEFVFFQFQRVHLRP